MRRFIILGFCLVSLPACNITDSSVTPPIPTQDQPPDLLMDQGEDQNRRDMVGDLAMDQTDQTNDLQDITKDIEPDFDPCGSATPPPDCNQSGLGPGTLITEFVIAEDTSCCRDFNGDGSPDNRLGTMLNNLRSIGMDINANADIKDAITTGKYIQTLEARHWRDAQNDSTLTLAFVQSKDADQDPNNNLNGMSTFYVSEASYDVSGAPYQAFKFAKVDKGELTAKEGIMTLPVPGLLSSGFSLEDVSLTAKVKQDTNLSSGGGFGLTDIRLAGILKKETLYDTINQVARNCDCLKRDVFKNDNGRYICMLEQDTCTQSPLQDCQTVGSKSLCSNLELANNFADVDTDGDNNSDAFSIGINAESVPATLELESAD